MITSITGVEFNVFAACNVHIYPTAQFNIALREWKVESTFWGTDPNYIHDCKMMWQDVIV